MSLWMENAENDATPWGRVLHVDVDATLEDCYDENFGPHSGVGSIVFHFEDDKCIVVSSDQSHMLSWR